MAGVDSRGYTYYWIQADSFLILGVSNEEEGYQIIPWYEYPHVDLLNHQLHRTRSRSSGRHVEVTPPTFNHHITIEDDGEEKDDGPSIKLTPGKAKKNQNHDTEEVQEVHVVAQGPEEQPKKAEEQPKKV